MRAEICHCSHDKATHFEGQHTCLGMRCDCTAYVHRDDPAPVKPAPPVRVHVDDDWAVPVDPITHKTGCNCAVCAWSRYWP